MTKFEYRVERVYVEPSTGKYARTKSNSLGLRTAMAKILNAQAAQGWRVISCIPVLRGEYDSKRGYSYSMTDAVVVVMERPGE